MLAAAATAGGVLLWSESQVPSYEVPNLVGRQEAEINALVGGNGWKIEIGAKVARTARRLGRSSSRTPRRAPSSTRVTRSSSRSRSVATLAPPPTDLVGLTEADAIARIEAAGFVAGEITQAYSEDVAPGIVLSMPEQPAELEKGSPIGFEVSIGPEPRTIPEGFGRPELRRGGRCPRRARAGGRCAPRTRARPSTKGS